MGLILSLQISSLKSENQEQMRKPKLMPPGGDKEECRRFAKAFGEASGDLTELYFTQIGQTYLEGVETKARQIYETFQAT